VGGFLDPGVYSPVVDDGFYVMFQPLAAGVHTLHVHGERDGCAIAPDPVSVDVTYHLTFVPVAKK
jgi:hypothetical protein